MAIRGSAERTETLSQVIRVIYVPNFCKSKLVRIISLKVLKINE